MFLRIKNFFENKFNFSVFVLILFSGLSFFFTLHHEMWRDEMQVWALAKASSSIPDLLFNMRYEGHPPLWHILVFTLQHFSNDPFSMQLLHWVIISLTAFVFLINAPLSRLYKVLILSGYFFIFEYNVISRNYSIEMLLLFLLLSSLNWKKPLLTFTLLFLICHTNIFGLIIAISLFAFLFISHKSLNLQYRIKERIFLAGFFLAGAISSIYQLIPPPDTAFAPAWYYYIDIRHFLNAMSSTCKAYLPLQEFRPDFWNQDLISWKPLRLILTLFIPAIIAIRYLNKPKLLGFFLFSHLCIWLFFYSKHGGQLRHHGHLYLIFILVLWLDKMLPEQEVWNHFKKLHLLAKRHFHLFLTIIFLTHIIAGSYAITRDFRDPFSQSKATAKYIKEKKLDTLIIGGDGDEMMISLSIYLNKKIYFPSCHDWGTFIKWNNKRINILSDSAAVANCDNIVSFYNQPMLFVLNRPLDSLSNNLSFIKSFTGAIVPDENYYLYLMKPAER